MAGKRWFQAKGEKAGPELVGTVDTLSNRQRGRRQMAQARLEAYEGFTIGDLRPDAYTNRSERRAQTVAVQIAQNIVDTAVAVVAARQRPKPQVLTKEADFRHRRQARKLSGLMEGVIWQPQGAYAHAWDLLEHVFKDGCLGDFGAVKIVPDFEAERIRMQRVFSWEVFVDPNDAEHGTPRDMFHRRKVDKLILADQFPDKRKIIMNALLHQDDKSKDTSDEAMCSLYEGWHLPSAGKSGVHAFAVAGRDGLLRSEPWNWSGFPIALYVWSRQHAGIGGTPVIDRVRYLQDMHSEMFLAAVTNARLLRGGWMQAPRGAYEQSEFESNYEMKLLEYDPDVGPGTVQMPSLFNPQLLEILSLMRGYSYEAAGVNEQIAQGQRSAGLTSGVAIRSENDIQSQRQLPKSRAYEQLYVDVGRRILWAAKDLKAAGKKLVVAREAGNRLLEEIEFDAIAPEDDDRFVVTIQASSTLEDTLAGRRQTIVEMRDSGTLSQDVAARLLAAPNPDLDAAGKSKWAGARYVEKIAAKFQDADEETWNPREDFENPDPHLDMAMSILTMTDAYKEMLEDEYPHFNMELVRKWIGLADAIEKRRMAPQQAGMGAPPVGPEGAPPPMPGGAEVQPVQASPQALPPAAE